jgi:hypothetical protein
MNATQRFTIKNYKTTRDHEGAPIGHFTLYVDGVKTALFDEDDHGGQARWDVINKAKYAEFVAYARALPATEAYGMTIPMDEDIFADELMGRAEVERKLRADMKKYLVFRRVDDKDNANAYSFVRGTTPNDPKAREYVVNKYPGAIIAADDFDAFLNYLMA